MSNTVSRGRGLTLFTFLLLACSPTPPKEPNHASAALKACAAVQTPTRVTTIATAVDRLNALPGPVTPACFVASLGRPLELVATTSIVSAQPAAGRKSPRIFILQPELVLSVVPDGAGATLLELSEWMTPTRTLKGEVELPLTSPLASEAPLTRVHSSFSVTSCGLCHRNETPHPSLDGGYVSDAYRPEPSSLVSVSELSAEHAACTEEDASDRCALFHALFDFGVVHQGAFSPELELFVR